MNGYRGHVTVHVHVHEKTGPSVRILDVEISVPLYSALFTPHCDEVGFSVSHAIAKLTQIQAETTPRMIHTCTCIIILAQIGSSQKKGDGHIFFRNAMIC